MARVICRKNVENRYKNFQFDLALFIFYSIQQRVKEPKETDNNYEYDIAALAAREGQRTYPDSVLAFKTIVEYISMLPPVYTQTDSIRSYT